METRGCDDRERDDSRDEGERATEEQTRTIDGTNESERARTETERPRRIE